MSRVTPAKTDADEPNAPAAGERVPDQHVRPSNAVIDTILRRRSVREGFRRDPIPALILEEVLRCGLAAPSSKNARPWTLHVVSDTATLDRLATAVATAEGADTYVPRDPATGIPRADWPSTVVESAEVLRSASAAIFVENRGAFSDGRRTLTTTTGDRLAGSLVGYTFEVLGIGAAIQNMWLAANSLGVVGTYLGDVVIAEPIIAAELGIALDLVGVLVLAYSDAPAKPERVIYDLDDEERVVWHR